MTNMPLDNSLMEKLPHRRMEAWKWTDVRGATAAEPSGLSSACNRRLNAPAGLLCPKKVCRRPIP